MSNVAQHALRHKHMYIASIQIWNQMSRATQKGPLG